MLYSLLFLLLHQSLFSTANLFHKKGLFRQELDFSESQHKPLNDTTPTLFFEVTKPIKLPNTKPCSYHILQHDFGYTYDKPPVLANYTPPSHCPSQKFSKIVLQWNATCKGRQFDRIFGVWLGGAELFRSCTAEPSATGIVWNVEKDITRYYSLLMKNQTLAVYLGNLITSTYTGVYHVNITIQFYPAEKNGVSKLGDLVSKYHSPANLIIPFSQNLPLNNGLWFEIENSTDIALREFKIPQNAYRAVLEVYVSFHENDESWYSNLYNEYIEANNITGVAGNGPFREVVVCLDGQVVGAIWPFTVIFTGGVNPLLWRPITGIGSFDLPSYNIEITPFLGKIIDGKSHKFGFSVTNALNVWYIDANLHLWLDSNSTKIDGKILEHVSSPLVVSLVSDFKGLNGTFLSSVSRSVSSTGWVMSSHGNITTNWIQNFSYNNSMLIESNGDLQIVNQTIHFNDSVHAKLPSSSVFSTESHKKFDLYSYYNELDEGNGTSVSSENVTLGFFEKKSKDVGFGFSKSSLENVQNGQGNMAVKNNLVVSGLGSTQQVYKYDGSDFCYFRNVSSSNYTILYDELGNICHKGTRSNSGFSKHGDLSKAEDCYTEGVNCVSTSETSRSCLRALMLCYSNRAATRMSLGRLRDALGDCVKAAAIDPNFLRVQLRAANCYLALGEVEDASKYFKRCLQLGSDICVDRNIAVEASDGLQKTQKVSVCMNRCAELMQRSTSNDAETALEVIAEALTLSSFSEKLLEMKANALFMLRRYDEVIQLCDQTLGSAEKNSPPVEASARERSLNDSEILENYYFRLWRCRLIFKSYFHLGRLEEGLAFLEEQQDKVSATNRNGSEALESLIPLAGTVRELLRHKAAGNEAFQAGRHAEAVEHYTAALSCNVAPRPFAAVCFCNRAAAYKASGQITDAIADCSLAIALDGNYLKAISRRATLYEMIRDYGQAASDLRRLVSILTKQVEEKTKQSGAADRSNSCANDLRHARLRLAEIEEEARKEIPLDMYLILGIGPSVSASEIKKAYRKAALKHHPDKASQSLAKSDNGDDRLWKAIAEEVHRDADKLFKMIGEAYAVLSDSIKRSRYDAEEEMRNAQKKRTGSSTSRAQTDAQYHPFETSSSRRQWREVWRSYGNSPSRGSEGTRVGRYS